MRSPPPTSPETAEAQSTTAGVSVSPCSTGYGSIVGRVPPAFLVGTREGQHRSYLAYKLPEVLIPLKGWIAATQRHQHSEPNGPGTSMLQKDLPGK